MGIRTYDHFNGHRLALGKQIEIADVGEDTKRITIIAPLYLNKRLEVPHCYSAAWSDSEILRDHSLGTFLIKRYGEY